MRHLTIEEQKQIIESAELYKSLVNYNFDIKQDFSVRYIVDDKFECWKALNINTIKAALFPVNSHICNVIGNMNYTQAYKNNFN